MDVDNDDADAQLLTDARAGIPVTSQRRFDVYKDVNSN